jgi:Ni,Fe-hydrogenase III small subunit
MPRKHDYLAIPLNVTKQWFGDLRRLQRYAPEEKVVVGGLALRFLSHTIQTSIFLRIQFRVFEVASSIPVGTSPFCGVLDG